MDANGKPYIQILEQPASREFRFRYECERRSHGSIPGVHTTVVKKTYPKIRVMGLTTNAYVIVSCVTKERPYKVHPHRLVSRDKSSNHGVYATIVRPDIDEVELKNISIQCVRKKDVQKSLDERKLIRVDPFEQGYAHAEDPGSIDLNVVRLCFQVYLYDPVTEKCTIKLTPVVSDPIYDKQTATNLKISKLSRKAASVAGGTLLTIFGYRVVEDEVKVRFFEVIGEHLIWETLQDPIPRDKYQDQTRISVLIPPYTCGDIKSPIRILIQLTKPSTGEAGKAVPFIFLPVDYDTDDEETGVADTSSKRKRPVIDSCDSLEVSNILPPCPIEPPNLPPSPDTTKPDSTVPNEEIEPSKCLDDIPQEKQYVYFNKTLNAGGFVMPYHKRPKYYEHPPFPTAPRVPYHPTMYPPHFGNSNMYPMSFNNPQCNCQYYPPLPSHCNSVQLCMPQPSSYMVQCPHFGGNLPRFKDRCQVPIHDQRNRNSQPKPILTSELGQSIVKVDLREVQPPIRFDVNPNDHLHAIGNIMDLDIDRYIDSLSGTLSDIKLNDEDGILVICDNQQDGHGQVQPGSDSIVKWSSHEMKSYKDYDYNTRNMLHNNRNRMEYDLLSNVEIANENNGTSQKSQNSPELERQNNTEENLLLVCDDTINEILKISQQQNL